MRKNSNHVENRAFLLEFQLTFFQILEQFLHLDPGPAIQIKRTVSAILSRPRVNKSWDNPGHGPNIYKDTKP
jgi:hypothetical protein